MDEEGRAKGAGVQLSVGRVYEFREKRKLLLRRLICVDDAHGELIFKDVAAKWSKIEKNAVLLKKSAVLGMLKTGEAEAVPDSVRPSFMSSSDRELEMSSPKIVRARANKQSTERERGDVVSSWLTSRDLSFEKIRPLVESEGHVDREQLLLLAYSPRYCAQTVADFARRTCASAISVKRLLHKYAWFGLDKNALLALDSFKGASGKLSRRNSTKPGPADAASRVYGDKYQTRNREAGDAVVILQALMKFWVGLHLTLTRTYDRMKLVFFRKSNQHGTARIQEVNVPTWAMFRYTSEILIQRNGLRAIRDGHKDGQRYRERRGRDSAIAPDVGSVFDADGTPFNRELVCRWKVGGELIPINVGKAYVILVFARQSRKCVGWHVYLGNENWQEGYRLALFCALTSKKAKLEWLGIDAPNAWLDDENIRPSFFYVDGGPGASHAGKEACDRMTIDLDIAPPNTPYWKANVEGSLGARQGEQSHLPGGIERSASSVEKESRRIAKQHAEDNIWEFERRLVLDIITYNDRWQPEMRLSAELKEEAGPDQTPNSVHSAGISLLGGVQRRIFNEAEAYERLLTRVEVAVTKDGVRTLRSQYNSDRLRRLWQFEGPVKIAVFYDPSYPEVIYWRTTDGVLDELTRDHASEVENGNVSVADMETYELAMQALHQRKSRKSTKTARVSRRQADLLTVIEKPRKKVKSTASKHLELTQALEAENERRLKTHQRPENFLSLVHNQEAKSTKPAQAEKEREESAKAAHAENEEKTTDVADEASGPVRQALANPNATMVPKAPASSGREALLAALNKALEEDE